MRTPPTPQAQSDVRRQVRHSRPTTEHRQDTRSRRRTPHGERPQTHQRAADQHRGPGPLPLAKRHAHQGQRRHSGRTTGPPPPTGTTSRTRLTSPLTLYSAKAIIVPHRIIQVYTLAVDVWAVTFGIVMRGLGGATASVAYQSPYFCRPTMIRCSAVLMHHNN